MFEVGFGFLFGAPAEEEGAEVGEEKADDGPEEGKGDVVVLGEIDC